jgi:hypothetical protein
MTLIYPGSDRGRTSSSGVLEALYCVAPWFLQRGATSKAGEEAEPPGPRGFSIEASANIAVKAESVRMSAIRRPPAARGLPLLL